MAFQRVVERILPDSSVAKVYPFHVCLEGTESVLLCQDDEDFDHLEKSFFLGALDANALVVSEIVLATRGLCAVLAVNWEGAEAVGEFVKKRHSQYIAKKYGERNVMARTRISVQYLDSDRYLRNALAYIPRNAVDTGYRIEDYPWSSYRGIFAGQVQGVRAVSGLSRREKETLLRTHKDLSQVPWVLDEQDRIVPNSACDCAYVESAFLDDQAYYLRMIGEVNPAEMRQKLVLNNHVWQSDSKFIVCVTDVAGRWFQKEVLALTTVEQAKLIIYLFRSYYTSVAQLARCLQLRPEDVRRVLWEHDIRPR
jgi:hypothetical protein